MLLRAYWIVGGDTAVDEVVLPLASVVVLGLEQGFKSPAIATAIARYSCLRKIKLFVSMYNLAAIARYIPI